MFSPSYLIFGIFLLVSLLCKSEAIQCYYCNSANNSACLDVKTLQDEGALLEHPHLIDVVQCERAIPSPVAVNFFCRKIVQTVYLTKHTSEVRVTRGCGWVRYHKDCYKADNADHLETVCQCFDDFCNTGTAIKGSMAMLFLTITGFLLRI